MRVTDLDVVSDERHQLGEGPIWDAVAGNLVFVDITGRRIHRISDDGSASSVIDAPSAVGAVVIGTDGRLYAGLEDGVYAVADWSLIAELGAGNGATRCNDGKVAPDGRLVQGTMAWDAAPGKGALFAVAADGETETLLSDLTVSNGLHWTADGSTMYHIDTPTRQIRAYGYPDVGGATCVVDVPSEFGSPDGMAVDDEGCLWVALWGGRAVHRYDPAGEHIGTVEVPAELVTSCAFGGDDRSTLFITTAGGLTDPGEDPYGGRVFACRPGVAGAFPGLFDVTGRRG